MAEHVTLTNGIQNHSKLQCVATRWQHTSLYNQLYLVSQQVSVIATRWQHTSPLNSWHSVSQQTSMRGHQMAAHVTRLVALGYVKRSRTFMYLNVSTKKGMHQSIEFPSHTGPGKQSSSAVILLINIRNYYTSREDRKPFAIPLCCAH